MKSRTRWRSRRRRGRAEEMLEQGPAPRSRQCSAAGWSPPTARVWSRTGEAASLPRDLRRFPRRRHDDTSCAQITEGRACKRLVGGGPAAFHPPQFGAELWNGEHFPHRLFHVLAPDCPDCNTQRLKRQEHIWKNITSHDIPDKFFITHIY